MDEEMSGEFGDNVSISSRRKSIRVTTEDEVSYTELESKLRFHSN